MRAGQPLPHALLSLLLVACSSGSSESDNRPQPAEGARDTLVWAVMADIGVLLPGIEETATDNAIQEHLYVETVRMEFDCSLKKNPGYAKSWQWNDDGTVLSMELRDDLQWEDGTPVTVDDIVFTYEVIADPKTASPRMSYIEYMKPGARPRVVDPTHIEWHFTHAYDRDSQIAHTDLGLLPKHRLADADRATLRGHELAKAPLAYGPFRFASYAPNERFVLEPNPAFRGPEELRPKLARVIGRVIPEYATRLIELQAGNVDLMEAVLVEDADRLRDTHPELRLVRRGWRSSDYIAWNLSNPLFQALEVRRAIAMATNVDAMIDRLLTSKKTGEKYGRRMIGTVTPALCGVHADEVTPIAHDLEAAKALLAKAGWTDTDGDGILDKQGRKFSFTLTTNSGNKRRADAAVLFQDQMKRLGIEVNLDRLESNTFFENLRNRQYEAALAGWSAQLFVDPTEVWTCDPPGAKRNFNFTGFCDPEVDALVAQGLKTPDPSEAAPIWKQVQARIHEQQPYLFLWWMDEIVAVHERFENTSIGVLSPIHKLNAWSVPADKVKYGR